LSGTSTRYATRFDDEHEHTNINVTINKEAALSSRIGKVYSFVKKHTFSNFKSITLSVYTERITYLFFAEKRFQPFITLNLPIEVYSAAASQGRGAPCVMFEPRFAGD
jgi:hypothetical protein